MNTVMSIICAAGTLAMMVALYFLCDISIGNILLTGFLFYATCLLVIWVMSHKIESKP